nr:MAG TPA: hypothetical protein [Caudoviricetes sp.]
MPVLTLLFRCPSRRHPFNFLVAIIFYSIF